MSYATAVRAGDLAREQDIRTAIYSNLLGG